jgi:hypothetical protein
MKTTTTLALMLAFVALPAFAGWADQAEIEGDMEEAERALARFAPVSPLDLVCKIKVLTGVAKGVGFRVDEHHLSLNPDNLLTEKIVTAWLNRVDWDIEDRASSAYVEKQMALDPLRCAANGECDGYAFFGDQPVIVKMLRDDGMPVVMATFSLDTGMTIKTLLLTRPDYLSCN